MKTILILITSLTLCFGKQPSAHVRYQWNYLNFTWPSTQAYNEAVRDHSYIPESNVISGIKVWKDRIYLTLPRYKPGVPATMALIPLNPIENNMAPLLEPFPNWEMQKLDDCSAFQYVQSMEIDVLGRMWILENGRSEFRSPKPRLKCPTRLVILDLEDNNKILLDYEFPNDVVHKDSVYSNDIVVDHEDGEYAYITDSDTEFPGVIVFSLKNMTSWKITHPTMEVDKTATELVVNGTKFSAPGAVNGIALSPASTEGNRTLYYTPFSSYNLYSAPVNQLKINNLQDVTKVTKKSSQNGGMVMSSDGHLYYGVMNNDAVAVWNTNLPFEEHIFFQDHVVNQFPDSYSIDKKGYVYWTTSRFQRFSTNIVNVNEPNYRIIASKTDSTNYQYYQNGSAPKLQSVS